MLARLKTLVSQMTGRRNRPLGMLQIEPTLQCGLSCVMCPWREMRPAGSVHMAWETFERLMPYLPLAERVDLTGGGEPTLHPRLVDMVAAAKAAGCNVGFSTNGVLLDAALAERLVDAGLDWISFSVDAATAETYERIRQGARFETVCSNIANLQALKDARGLDRPELLAVFVMMRAASNGGQEQGRDNYREIPDFIELAHSLGVERVVAKNLDVILQPGDDQRRVFRHDPLPALAVQAALEAAADRAQALGVSLRSYNLHPVERAICEHDPLHSLFINWQGRVSPCITLAYAEDRLFDGQPVKAPCLRFGNVQRDALPEIWKQPDYRRFRQQFERRLQWERQSVFQAMLSQEPPSDDLHSNQDLPPAPESCRTCYYLYGV